MERILEAPKWSISNMMHNPEKELAVYYQKQSFGSVQVCNFIKKYTLAQVFTCEIWKNFKKTYFHRIPPVAAFVLHKNIRLSPRSLAHQEPVQDLLSFVIHQLRKSYRLITYENHHIHFHPIRKSPPIQKILTLQTI